MDIKNLPNIIIARNLVRLREERGWEQHEVAALYGCNPQYISQLETGRRGFGKRTIPKLLKVFDVTLGEFLKMPNELSSQEIGDYWEKFIRIKTGPHAELFERISRFLEKAPPSGIGSLENFMILMEEAVQESR
jgi:transcriptional regulator with XRE-family HTH domain